MSTVSLFRCHLRLLLPIFCWLGFAVAISAVEIEKPDSTKIHVIKEVTVTEKLRHSEIRATAPLQVISAKNIEKLNVLQISDAVKFFSGVTVRDYGGIGGLKTISVRSLGANHTAVSYDGITLTDCQTGQIDIGRFSLENVDMISLSSGQSDNIFQPARVFASASVLNINTITPHFIDGKTFNGKISMKVGSFGMINPAFWLEGKISPVFSYSFSAEWLSANGKYPYTLHYGSASNDSLSTEIRQNTDVKNLRLESSVYAQFTQKESAYVKTYYYQSERGLPGATVFYNTANFSSQRIWDKTFFTQAHYEKEYSKSFAFQSNAKYNRGYLHYLDPTYLDSKGKLDNTYLQQEIYVSLSALYRTTENLSISLATDGATSSLQANINNFSTPTRLSWLSTMAAKYVTNQFLAMASCLATVTSETVQKNNFSDNHKQLSPYISVSVKPFLIHDFRIRAFYKNIFRLPSFNDLYYSGIGNRDLKPEKTNQYNLGITYSRDFGKNIPTFSLTLDTYHNDVTDKIVAYPTSFFWTIMNKGKVSIDGLDVTAETTLKPFEKFGIILGTTYTYQRALNVTNVADRDYKHQLPYTPRVSGSGKVGLETPWVNFSYAVIWSGHRYAVNQNYAENRLPGYADHSISFAKTIQTKHYSITGNIEVLNLLNENYAIVKWFPMPGRSVRASFSVKF